MAERHAERFNQRKLKGFVNHELQAHEIRTFVGDKEQVVWILTTLEVWSRPWISVVVGRRGQSLGQRRSDVDIKCPEVVQGSRGMAAVVCVLQCRMDDASCMVYTEFGSKDIGGN
jgi:hypothetical protein